MALERGWVVGLFLLFGCLLVIGLDLGRPGNAFGREVVDRIVAIVNDDIITLSQLNRSVKPWLANIKKMGYSQEKEHQMIFRAREDILQQLINEKLTDQEIERFKVSVTEREIDAQIERIKKSRFLTEEELRETLERQGITLENYRERLKKDILRVKLVNREVKSKIVITNEDIKAYYDKHKEEYSGKRKYHLRNILKRVPVNAVDEFKEEIRLKMEEVLKKLEAGQPFEVLARTYSDSPIAAEGGDLGVFSLDQLSPEIREAIIGKRIGEFTSILDTEQGFQVFYIQNIIKSRDKPLEEVSSAIQEKILREIMDTKFETWIEGLRNFSHIKIIR